MKCTQHSKKCCCCGGHNHSNVKKNKLHNSTKKKLKIKETRKAQEKFLIKERYE